MQFAPLPDSLNLAPLGGATSDYWAQVDDFNWLKADHSPNWKILTPEDGKGADHWKRLLNATDDSVSEILEAFETTGWMPSMEPGSKQL
ncbi:MAG: hypothetical protein Q9173_003161 [Seirophora scorigena]